MNYESKIFFVVRHTNRGSIYGEEICRFDMYNMGDYKFKGKSFNQVFNKPIDFGLNENKDIWSNESRLDKYGVHCCWATVDEVIEWLELYIKEIDYRNAELLLSFCYLMKEQIKNNKWGQVCVVHYGY